MSLSPDRRFYVFNALVSSAAFAFLIWLTLIQNGVAGLEVDLSFVPAVNAGLNALASVLLVSGFLAIRSGRRELHKRLMVSAFACSAVFLVGYVLYHAVHGDTRYEGPLRDEKARVDELKLKLDALIEIDRRLRRDAGKSRR